MIGDNPDRLTFWRNWYDGFRQYPDELRLAAYDAILAFAFDGEEPAPSDGDIGAAIKYQAVAMIRATVDISRKRREIGSKGGSKAQAKRKQTPSKAQANANQEQVQEQEHVQEQEQEHIAICSTATRGRKLSRLTVDQFVERGKLAGVPADFARGFHADLVAADWRDAEGLPIGNPIRYLKSAWVAEQKKISAARVNGPTLDDFPIAR